MAHEEVSMATRSNKLTRKVNDTNESLSGYKTRSPGRMMMVGSDHEVAEDEELINDADCEEQDVSESVRSNRLLRTAIRYFVADAKS
jgi:hypothetical protein